MPLPALHERTRQFASRFGVTSFNPPNDLHNTRRALAIAELARDRGRLEPFRSAAFEAHWRLGKNLEDDADLAAIAVGAGLPEDEALRAADDPAILARVDQKQDEARRSGVTGIPTFIIAGEEVVGCQPYKVLAAAAERAGVAPLIGDAASGANKARDRQGIAAADGPCFRASRGGFSKPPNWKVPGACPSCPGHPPLPEETVMKPHLRSLFSPRGLSPL